MNGDSFYVQFCTWYLGVCVCVCEIDCFCWYYCISHSIPVWHWNDFMYIFVVALNCMAPYHNPDMAMQIYIRAVNSVRIKKLIEIMIISHRMHNILSVILYATLECKCKFHNNLFLCIVWAFDVHKYRMKKKYISKKNGAMCRNSLALNAMRENTRPRVRALILEKKVKISRNLHREKKKLIIYFAEMGCSQENQCKRWEFIHPFSRLYIWMKYYILFYEWHSLWHLLSILSKLMQ